ncbi:hypothetical protein AB1L16_19395 [Peribacillus frigoritolerans]|uniref:hypothetical protein n=1 Tax=Peribacillus frigoritolerans TaxID=450367 RepID=UPI0039A1ECF9
MKQNCIKLIKATAILLLILMPLVTTTSAFAEDSEQVKKKLEIQTVKRLIITLPENPDSSIIDMYENGGWQYNPTSNQLEKPVTYKDLEIEVDGKPYTTDDNGVVEVPVEKGYGEDIKIETEQLSASGKNSKEDEQKLSTTVEVSNEPIVIEEYINLNHILNSMGKETSNDTTENTAVSNDQVGEMKAKAPYLDDKQLPSRGRALHCNRFNGFQGDGKYYEDEASWAAVRNFFQSDCDVSLGKSNKCLADYGSNPYCAAKPASKNGHCGDIVGHANGYHKHTGWFSPSK